ncbi:uncharacterized protein LOC105704199 [Orussus abietinus]|uniref:uncharacterized protein LOC105704199 n=1 Tax=Orussus abietinus TaxID=222816 RepID=UPI000625026D|nr:uncharacterized protein LOC105704199 [Orussus abietinus]XP_012288661.1 uncharacterized protein LOC105704199 [Orussus abietinus]
MILLEMDQETLDDVRISTEKKFSLSDGNYNSLDSTDIYFKGDTNDILLQHAEYWRNTNSVYNVENNLEMEEIFKGSGVLRKTCTDVTQVSPVMEKSNNFVCSVCGDCFPSEKQFYGHLRIHTGEVLWHCTLCPESNNRFESQSRLRIHENLCHTVVRPFKCEQCGLVFDRASQLDYHQRSVHLGEKSQVCQICGKGFFRRTDLRTHLNIHLGTNLCMCEICGRKFNHVSNLIRHCRIHAGIKPYPCTICGKRFTQISSLARHKRTHNRSNHHTERSGSPNEGRAELNDNLKGSGESANTGGQKVMKRHHYCKICGESFQFVLLLRQHEKHHLENIHKLECKSCRKKFSKLEEIKDHCCQEYENAPFLEKDGTDLFNNIEKINNNAQEIVHCNQNSTMHVNNVTDNMDHNNFIKSKDAKRAQSIEAVVYMTSEQLANISLEHGEDTSGHILSEHFLEIAGKIGNMGPDRDIGLNISDILNTYESEESEPGDLKLKSSKIHGVLSLKKNDTADGNNFIYVQASEQDVFEVMTGDNNVIDELTSGFSAKKFQKNRISNLEDSCSVMSHSESLNVHSSEPNLEMLPYDGSQLKLATGDIRHERLDQCNKMLNINGEQFYVEICDPDHLKHCSLQDLELQESETVPYMQHDFKDFQSDSRYLQTDTNTNRLLEAAFQKDHTSETEKVHKELDDLVGDGSTIASNSEPTLRLVQTDTGQQFYELVINNILDRTQSDHSLKDAEHSKDMEDKMSHHGNSHCVTNDQFLDLVKDNSLETKDGELQEFAQLDDKITSSDMQDFVVSTTSDGDHFLNLNYKKSNFEDFVKAPFDGSAEKIFEFVDNAENVGEIGTEKHSDGEAPMVRLVQNEEGEQFFELIRDSSDLHKTHNMEFQSDKLANQSTNISREQSGRKSDTANCLGSSPELDTITTLHSIMPTNEGSPKRKEIASVSLGVDSLTNDLMEAKEQSSVPNAGVPVKKFQCTVCTKSFSTRYNFKQHIGTHFTDQQKFHCKECGIQFAWKSTLNKHIAMYHRPDGPQKFVCEICPKVYSTLSQVNEHVKRDHLKQRNHVCSHCGKCFFKKFDLKTHSRTHTNERPYVCRACGKGFHHQSHIIRHERIHSGEKPYACDICQRTFAQPGSLRTHKQKHREADMDILDRLDEDDPLTFSTI